jgi:phosphoglycolate phosphatase
MTIDAVCFDLDGTLVDSRAGIETALRSAVADVLPGQPIDESKWSIGPPLEVILQQLLPDNGDAHEAIAAAFRHRYDTDGWRSAKPYPGVIEALDALAATGLRLDVVTNKRSVPTSLILERPPLGGRFSLAISLDTAEPPHRTKADALATLVATIGLPPSRVAYVGDSADDRVAARLTGCEFVAIGWGYGRAAETTDSRDLVVVTSPADLSVCLLQAAHQ